MYATISPPLQGLVADALRLAEEAEAKAEDGSPDECACQRITCDDTPRRLKRRGDRGRSTGKQAGSGCSFGLNNTPSLKIIMDAGA